MKHLPRPRALKRNIINDDSSTKPYQTLLGSAVRQLEMLGTELLLDLKFAAAFFFAYSHL